MNETFAEMIRRGDFVVLDTETTGLDELAEICQIAIIAADGEVLLDTLVKPVRPIPADATRIHGITNDMVAGAPGWPELMPQIDQITAGRDVVIYNADYDWRLMNQSAEARGKDPTTSTALRTWCAMETFAEVYGDWNDYRGNYRWQKLTTAARHYDLPVEDAHSALGDCRMTLAVCRAMAAAAGINPYTDESLNTDHGPSPDELYGRSALEGEELE